MSLSLNIPRKDKKSNVNPDGSPTTAVADRPPSLKLNIPSDEPIQRKNSSSKSNSLSPNSATLSPNTAYMTSPSSGSLMPPVSGIPNLSRRASYAFSGEEDPSNDIIQVLQSLPFFAGAPSSEAFVEEIGTCMKIRYFKPGDSVLKHGDIAKCMFLIIKGDLSVLSEDNEVEYATLSAGSFVGEIGVLLNTVRTANVVARSKSILAALTVDVIQEKLEKYPDIKELISVKVKERLEAIEAIKSRGTSATIKSDIPPTSPRILQKQNSFKGPSRSPSIKSSTLDSDNATFLHIPDQMDFLKHSSRRSSSDSVGDSSSFLLAVPDGRGSPLSRRSSFMTSDSMDEDVPPLARRKSSIRFDISKLAALEVSQQQESNLDLEIVGPTPEIQINLDDTQMSYVMIEDSNKTPRAASYEEVSFGWNIPVALPVIAVETPDEETPQISIILPDQVSIDFSETPHIIKRTSSKKLFDSDAKTITRKESFKIKDSLVTANTANESVDIMPTLTRKESRRKSHSEEKDGEKSIILKRNSSKKFSSEPAPVIVELATPIITLEQQLQKVSIAPGPISLEEQLQKLEAEKKHEKLIDPPRRISVAVWSDQKLMQQINKKKEDLHPNVQSSPSSAAKWIDIAVEGSFAEDEEFIQDEEESSIESEEDEDDDPSIHGERILAIASRVMDIETICKLRQVSFSMKDLISEARPSALKSISLNSYRKKMTDRYVTSIAKFAGPSLEYINLHACWQLSDRSINTIAKNCPNLTRLVLSEVWEITDSSIINVSKNCSKLTSLDLSNCRKIGNEGICSLLENCKELKSLSLSYCKALGDSALSNGKWSHLEHVNFHRCTGLTDRGFESWAAEADFDDMWIQSRSLQASRDWNDDLHTDLDHENDGDRYFEDNLEDEVFSTPGSAEELDHELKSDQDVSQFADKEWGKLGSKTSSSKEGSGSNSPLSSIRDSKTKSMADLSPASLPKLKMSMENDVHDPDNLYSPDSMSPTSSPSYSSLSESESKRIAISDEDISVHLPKIFMESESNLKGSFVSSNVSALYKLKHINLRDCSFLTDSTIASIASVCGHLRVLNLSFCCSLTSDFSRHLVKGCGKLTHLDVSFCGAAITDSTLLHLSTGLKKLKALSIRGCIQVTDVGIDHLYENSTSLNTINLTQCRNISPETAKKLGTIWRLLDVESVTEMD